MDALLFALIVAGVAAVGVLLGLAAAPLLWRWDERRSRGEEEEDESVERKGEDERD